MRRLRVLVSAYACQPRSGSEPGVGWGLAQELARHHDVWVVTRENNRSDIEAEARRSPSAPVNYVYHDLPNWARFWKRGQRGVRAYYYLWQLSLTQRVRRLFDDVKFDIAHHVTFAKYWAPSCLATLPTRFVWGPVGGAEVVPKAFWRTLGAKGIAYETAREIAKAIGERDPFVRLTARRSAIALATTHDTARRLRAMGARRVLVRSEAGLSDAEVEQLGTASDAADRRMRFIGIGRLVHLKGFQLGLQALHEAGISGAEMWLVGDGPERSRLEAQSRKLGLGPRVRFLGKLPREEALRKLSECDVLVHPSLHDSGGWVCLEAMAAGKPVICLDLGGPGLQVTDAVGVRVIAQTPGQVVWDIAAAMRHLGTNAGLRKEMGRNGRERVREHFRWPAKVAMLEDIYAQAMSEPDASIHDLVGRDE